MTRTLHLLRLCQLVSPALPIGAYHFSQGLESAADRQWLEGEADVLPWILGIARHGMATLDLPILLRLHAAWSDHRQDDVVRWSRTLIASRETAELRAEERHMGQALAKVLREHQIAEASSWVSSEDASYSAMFCLAAVRGELDASETAAGMLWAWGENQVLAALKLLPLGQAAGQRILNRFLPEIPSLVAHALTIEDDEIAVATPLLSMASAWHETQYSRLFRS